MLVAIDIEHFRFFNKLYGTAEGDKLLKHVGRCLEDICAENGGVAGYMGLDNYAILMPNKDELLKKLKNDIADGVRYAFYQAAATSVANVTGTNGLPLGTFAIDNTDVTVKARDIAMISRGAVDSVAE